MDLDVLKNLVSGSSGKILAPLNVFYFFRYEGYMK
jgi:hypothetical protein